MPINHHQNIIEIKNLAFGYGAAEPVLQNINLNIHRGDYLGIVGPNGGGKTTLIKLILGLLAPNRGEVRLFGQTPAKFKDWSKVGYVPQKAVAFDSAFPATVEEVVAMGRYGSRRGRFFLNREDRKIIGDALREVGIEDFGKRLVGALSAGQQQRVFIARALASRPEILFLDEPTAGIDIEAQEKFYLLLRELNQKLGLTLVLISHDIDVMTKEATEFACINQTLIYHGSPEQFIKDDYFARLYGKDLRFILHGH